MKARKEEPAAVSRMLRPMLFGLIAGFVGCFLLLLIMAGILTAKDIPLAVVTPMSVLASAVGAFLGGFVAARTAGERGLLYGALLGIVLYLIIMIAGFAYNHQIQGGFAIVKLAVLLATGAIGGVVGVNFKKRR